MINAYVVFALLVVFQFKHFLADYPLQGKYMMGKFLPGWAFVKPLAAHCSVHAAMTLGILLMFGRGDLWWLAIFDFVAHFVMDRVKASPKLLGRYKALSGKEYMDLVGELFEPISRSEPISNERRKQIMDRIENNTLFWWALGVDQGWHHLTHYVIIGFMVLTK